MTTMQDMQFLIDFNLEIFHGCRWNCAGCRVDKYVQDGFQGDDHAKLLSLFDDLVNNNHILSNLGLGPTDFMVCDNLKEMMPLLVPMMDRFSAITLQCTFLEKPAIIREMAEFMRPYLAGRTVKFATPVDPEHYQNKKLFDVIIRNRDLFVSLIPEMTYTKTYLLGNLVEYKDYNANPFNNQNVAFEEFSETFHESSRGNHLDLIIADGRLPMSDINNREKLKSAIRYQNRLYNESVVTDSSKVKVNFTLGNRHEGTDKDYVYRNGRIYSPVFVGEPLLMFENEFSLDNSHPWTTSALVDFENQGMIDSLLYLNKTDSCESCEFATLCVSRGILKMMEVLNVRSCMAPKQAMMNTRQQ